MGQVLCIAASGRSFTFAQEEIHDPRRFVLVPLMREKSHHITVEARLAGRSARFIVDTGAGGTIVDASAAMEYKLKVRSRCKKGGGVGSSAMQMSIYVSPVSTCPRPSS